MRDLEIGYWCSVIPDLIRDLDVCLLIDVKIPDQVRNNGIVEPESLLPHKRFHANWVRMNSHFQEICHPALDAGS